MYIIDGKRYYTKKEVADMVGVSPQMIQLYHKWSDEREEKGEPRFIPAPKRVKGGVFVGEDEQMAYKVWTEEDVELIKEFREGIDRGDLAEYSKQQWSYLKKEHDDE